MLVMVDAGPVRRWWAGPVVGMTRRRGVGRLPARLMFAGWDRRSAVRRKGPLTKYAPGVAWWHRTAGDRSCSGGAPARHGGHDHPQADRWGDRIWSSMLGLADHGLRLQVPLLVGLVVDPLVPTKEPQESTTVTPAEIIYHRRVQVLDRAGQTSVTEACRTFGVSRTTYYRWAGRAQRSGLAALLPKDRRPPVLPTATPPTRSRRCWPRRCPPHHRGSAAGRAPGR